MNNTLNCIHVYEKNCKTNNQSPGLGDFIRGSITLMKYSKIYNYNFYFDYNSHELFKFLQKNEYIKVFDDHNMALYELLPPLDYESINNKLNNIFKNKNTFKIITNAFYNYPNNYGEIPNEIKIILKHIFIPNDELLKELQNIKINIKLNNYIALHVRTGDKSIHTQTTNNDLLNELNLKIQNIINEFTSKNVDVLLICDSNEYALELCKKNNKIKYYETKKIHLGDRFLNKKNDDEYLKEQNNAIKDTLIDFFLLAGSQTIISLPGSGFSTIISLIFDIPYIMIEYDSKKYNNMFHSPI